MASVSCFCEERRKSRQLSSCRHGTTKRVYRSMKGHEEGKLQKLSKNNWCCNLSFDNWGISHLQGEEQQKFRLVVTIERQCRTHRHWTIYPTSVLPVQLVLNKETKTPLTRNGWMVRVCLNSNNIVGANVQNVTGHYSAVNWYRCVSHCGAAKELLLCLFVYQLLSQQSRCVSRCNQILQPNLTRWQARKTRRGEKSTRSSKMGRRIRNNQKNKSARPPSSNIPFGENSATERDLFECLRTAKDELLARGVFLLLSRSHAPKLLLFVHFLSLSSLEVAGIETCAQRTWQWIVTPLLRNCVHSFERNSPKASNHLFEET